jgi:hypothetical protein
VPARNREDAVDRSTIRADESAPVTVKRKVFEFALKAPCPPSPRLRRPARFSAGEIAAHTKEARLKPAPRYRPAAESR